MASLYLMYPSQQRCDCHNVYGGKEALHCGNIDPLEATEESYHYK